MGSVTCHQWFLLTAIFSTLPESEAGRVGFTGERGGVVVQLLDRSVVLHLIPAFISQTALENESFLLLRCNNSFSYK